MNRETFSTQQMYILDSYIEHMRNTRSLVTNAMNMYSEQERTFRTMLMHSVNEDRNNSLREEIARHNTSRPNSNTNTNRHSTAEDVMNILNRRGTARTRTTTTRREWTIPNNQNTDADNTTNPTQHLADGRHLRDFVQFFNVDNLQDVVVTPSERDVCIATTTRRFSSLYDPINDVCPITQQRFEPNDMVTRIDHCGHVFSSMDLTRWFRRSVRCPVCRFDIREANISSTHYNRAVNEIVERHRNRENLDNNADDNTNNETEQDVDIRDDEENNENSNNEDNENNDTNQPNTQNDHELDENTLRNMTSLILQDISNGNRNATQGFDASGNAVFTYNLLSVIDISNNRHMTFHS